MDKREREVINAFFKKVVSMGELARNKSLPASMQNRNISPDAKVKILRSADLMRAIAECVKELEKKGL